MNAPAPFASERKPPAPAGGTETAEASVHGRTIVCVGSADWDAELWTNQQHLMSRLARSNRVLFIESLGLRRPRLAGRDLRRIARRVLRALGGPRVRDGVLVHSPLVLPFHGTALTRRLNRALLRRSTSRAARRLGAPVDVLWAYAPQAEALVERLRPRACVYHCVDDLAAQPGVDPESFRAAERRFVAAADLVLASAPGLVERLGAQSAPVTFAPNVADHALFATALGPGATDPALASLPRPRIVFCGAIVATKVDLALVSELARLRPGWSFVLVGPVGAGDPGTDTSVLEDASNVHLVGPRHYRELPAVLRGADAGLIPYALNDLTRCVFPMKVYEYLAAGLPVVATRLPSLEGVEGVVTAATAAEMAARLDERLRRDGPSERARRSRLAAAHSWDARIEQIARSLEPALEGR